MTDDSQPRVFDALPSQPISTETVTALGESDAITGTMPIQNRHNDIITEFLLYFEDTIYALAFDPDTSTWHILETRPYNDTRLEELENELMALLYEWREEHVLPYLIENDLIPTIEM
ncbi:hypothetical protein [Halococcus sp. AFM35]|uniref:hypothetical protein n=1 Tax=Halococcus sp. AFM35 TaxID=3421653 RepID=UPI003EBFFA3F